MGIRQRSARDARATMADVARRAGLMREEAERFLVAVVEELALGREVRLPLLGFFTVRVQPRRTVCSSLFERPIVVSERRVVSFRGSKALAARLNEREARG